MARTPTSIPIRTNMVMPRPLDDQAAARAVEALLARPITNDKGEPIGRITHAHVEHHGIVIEIEAHIDVKYV